MKRVTQIATATILALLVALTFTAAAQQPDTRDRTIMKFSSAVELPGMRLEPGTYVFRLADSASRNVIQVLDEHEKDIMGQWLFIPAERAEVTGDTVVTFRETSAASTPAVQYWYYPGERIGKEFLYPRDQALRIAQRTGATVQTEEGPVGEGAQASAPAEPAVEPTAEPQPETAAATPEPRTETTVAAAERPPSSAVGTAGTQAPVAADADAPQPELPATASPLGLAGLLGLLSLAGAAGIRTFRL